MEELELPEPLELDPPFRTFNIPSIVRRKASMEFWRFSNPSAVDLENGVLLVRRSWTIDLTEGAAGAALIVAMELDQARRELIVNGWNQGRRLESFHQLFTAAPLVISTWAEGLVIFTALVNSWPGRVVGAMGFMARVRF